MAEIAPDDKIQEHWQAEYEFWNKIITDEVARRRFNDGFEPIDAELIKSGDRLIGKVRICHRDFRVIVYPTISDKGQKIFKLQVRSEKR